jgi:pyridoxal phosphate enzyme (YggS family)
VIIADNLRDVRRRIESAKERKSTDQAVQVVAVTKTHPFAVIRECYKAGIVSIGENRIQEASEKFQNFSSFPRITKRFIGHLQTNKVKKCLDLFDTIDSVDSIKLARKISNLAESLGKTLPVLLEVNTTKEKQKHGFLSDQLEEMISCVAFPGINVRGLMTIGPVTRKKNETRRSFIILREVKERLNNKLKEKKVTELSMGMSSDFEIAIEEGSTMIRLGTVLLGPRCKL